ncbi:methyltransferase [Lacrimispora defluvii]|uniref:Methyltransferase domain-containing protein n=1 Tax=Lacrimispora defluvii TaxID=2719233 RepID=A0ABX1VPT8_9FIRM|nr:methyltransferase domain-containing protein [Lacrimispora defluvii]NNJ30114.1 methyltransferase domain-containing protein [Lacrimispora defluvii]
MTRSNDKRRQTNERNKQRNQKSAARLLPYSNTSDRGNTRRIPSAGGGYYEVLEPGAGSGNIIKVLQKHGNFKIDAVEIRPEEAEGLKDLDVNVIIDDYLSMKLEKKYDLIIGNPPFGLAMEFVKKSLSLLKPDGCLMFLLRTAFMESDQRFEFWQEDAHQLAGLYTLHKRPSFTGHGTDATSYSWFIWQPGSSRQIIKVI